MAEVETTNSGNPPPRIGSYQLIHSLGSGGMSSVFKAVHVETGHEVAVKVLPRALAKNATLLQRFIREAKNAESLEHPNIVSIYDRGVDQGRHYLVLEFVAGSDLHERVKQGGPLDPYEAVEAIRAVATGLQFAASRGLIHRDIKPANLLITPSKQIKIIDLGLALHAENEDERVTREGTTVGTVDYMSPEQARDSRATSERSDIYSLGCTFYFLLTGAPPFPGGGIADKLSRHCLAPVPDVRTLRPAIPGPLAQLIRRMMAKRPENRFANYQELIDALDLVLSTIPRSPESSHGEEPLFALIDEDGDGDRDPLPTLAPLTDSTPALGGQPEPVFALIDEEPEPTELPPGMLELLEPDSPGHPPKANDRGARTTPSEVSLTELAELDDSLARPIPHRAPGLLQSRSPGAGIGRFAEVLLEDARSEDLEHGVVLGGSRRYDDPIKKLIITYSLIGLGLIVFVIGVHQLYRASVSRPAFQVEAEPTETPIDQPQLEVAAPSLPRPTVVPSPPAPTRPKRRPPPEPSPDDSPRWVEPDDLVSKILPEAEFGEELESQFIPVWARGELPNRLGQHFVTVRRVVNPKDPAQKHALRQALEVIGGTIEIGDNGPFFEDDLRVRGESLLIRAKPGYRPIICVDPPSLDVVRDQPAVVVLEGKSLTLEGLDLVVNVSQLPLSQTALFQSRGGTLNLKQCTITIVNPRRKPFALVRSMASESPTRVRLERTMVRGTAFTAIDLSSGPADVILNRSVVASGGAPAIQNGQSEGSSGDRTVHLVRSLICSRGPVLELDPPGSSGRSGLLTLKVLGSTFAQLAGEGSTSLIVSGLADGRAEERLTWVGDHNRFSGWRDWFAFGGGRTVKVPDLATARSVWEGIEAQGQQDSGRWQVTQDPVRITPSSLMSHSKEVGGTLTRVASPSPWLFEKTLESFPRFEIPPRLQIPAESVAPTPRVPSLADGTETAEGDADPAVRASTPATRELTFNLAAGPWNGDLGRFLLDRIRPGERRIRVVIEGDGARYSTPIRLPEGLSLELKRPAHAAPIILSAVKGAPAEALFETRGGDLVLSNIHLTRDGHPSLKSLVRVDGGHLILDGCWLTAPGVVEPGGGNLVAFRAPGTEPRPESTKKTAFVLAVDRPVCRIRNTLLLTGGDAIRAEIGRGWISLVNCAMATGRTAFDLQPSKVARHRFDAGLTLDGCTVASEGSFVTLGSWPGTAPGPDRPWLVSTKDSAFLAGYDRSGVSTESVLLRVAEDSLERGALCWQAANASFEVVHFTGRTGQALAMPRRPDVTRQWIKLWGDSHMQNVTGPIWPRGAAVSSPSVRFYDRLQSGKVVPADLELDRGYHPGRPRMNLGADLTRLHVKVRKRDRR